MKRFPIIPVLLLFSFTGCRTIVDRPAEKKILPDKSEPALEITWYAPKAVNSAEEAMANIKNLQNSVKYEGMLATRIEIDKFGLRAQLQWDETEVRTMYSETSGSSFVYGSGFGFGWVNSSGDTQTSYLETLRKEKAVILPFNEIEEIELGEKGAHIIQKGGEETYVETDTPYNARLFADSLFTLSIRAFGTPSGDTVGIRFRDLTPEQKNLLGMEYGKLVTLVMKGSPADRAGIQRYDILTHIDGRPLDGGNASVTAGRGAAIRFSRWTEKKSGDSVSYDIEEFETTLKPEARQ